VLEPWDLKRILSSKPHWCGLQAFGLCSLFLLAKKFFSFVPHLQKKKKKTPLVCAGESLAGPQPPSLTWGCQRACQSSICCASEKGKKNSGKCVRITTGGKEVTGRCRAEGPALCSGPMVHRRPFYW
jgi:hypothetical protein